MRPQVCLCCGRSIEDRDVLVQAPHPESGHPIWVHVTCTKHGIERWLRENRPGNSPLEWARSERPTWRTHQWGNNRAVRGDPERLQGRSRSADGIRGP